MENSWRLALKKFVLGLALLAGFCLDAAAQPLDAVDTERRMALLNSRKIADMVTMLGVSDRWIQWYRVTGNMGNGYHVIEGTVTLVDDTYLEVDGVQNILLQKLRTERGSDFSRVAAGDVVSIVTRPDNKYTRFTNGRYYVLACIVFYAERERFFGR